jgi:hypothetical protein
MPPAGDGPAAHLSCIAAEAARAGAAPLSVRRVLLVCALLDQFAERVFAARQGDREAVLGAEDILAYRAALAQQEPALGLIFDLCAQSGAAQLGIATLEVPLADYPHLSVADFMVSLYNRHSVQRVVLKRPGGPQVLAHEAIARALAYWRGVLL